MDDTRDTMAMAILGLTGPLGAQPLDHLHAVFAEVTGEETDTTDRAELARRLVASVDHDALWASLRVEIEDGLAVGDMLPSDPADRAILRHRLGHHPEVAAVLDLARGQWLLTLSLDDMQEIIAFDDSGDRPCEAALEAAEAERYLARGR